MNRKSSILSALMFVIDFFSALFKELKARNVSEEQIFDAMKSKSDLIPQMAERIADFVMKTTTAVKDAFHVILNYGLSLEAMIREGNYNWTNSDITERHFPIDHTRGTAEVDIQLIHFNRDIESDDVVRELDRMRLRPATLPELLGFGKAHPEKQREFPIVALGSVWQDLDGRYVAGLDSDSDGRGLALGRWGLSWDAHYRFAAVRK